MPHLLRQIGIGFLAGVLIGAVAFESVAVISFGLGWYSSAVLTQSAIYGAIAGALFGPVFFMRRTPWLKAGSWEAIILSVAMLLLIGATILSGPVFAPGKEGELIVSIVQQIVVIALAGFLAGAGMGWAANLFPKDFFERQDQSITSPKQKEQIYRL